MPDDVPRYVVPHALIDAIVGFRFTYPDLTPEATAIAAQTIIPRICRRAMRENADRRFGGSDGRGTDELHFMGYSR